MDYRKTALKKISKLLYLICYTGEVIHATPCTITPPIQAKDLSVIGMNQEANIHSGAHDLIQFLQIHRTFFYPSNTGSWTADIGYFLLCLTNEMGQHLGQSILLHSTSLTSSDSSSSSSGSSPSPLHLLTMKYLCGALTSIVLEGLYGKSPFMIQSCNFCLRNLCAIEPSLGHVIMPFLVASLHPDAVNQSHMAPSSMTAINHIFKPLLYPEPVVLPYLEELLQLSLAGIDPNDTHKTMTTLAMYNSIFSWIPTSSLGDETNGAKGSGGDALDHTIPPHYLELTFGRAAPAPASTSENYSILFNDKVARVVISWYPKFLEKLFSLLNSKEKSSQSADNKASRQPSPVAPYIEESFYEVISCLSPTHRRHTLDMVLEYSKSSHATNSIKEIGKMFENLLSLDPNTLPMVLEKIIDPDLLSAAGGGDDCSIDKFKLAMKIRFIGACLRRVGGEHILQILSQIQFLFDEKLKHHEEKIVRKACCKFYKDLLKGLSSFYLLPVPTTDSDAPADVAVTGEHILGRPNHADTVKLEWHIPSAQSLSETVKILQLLASSSMSSVESILSEDDTAPSSPGDLTGQQEQQQQSLSLSLKKTEEKIVTHLQILRRCLRGAAEVLGDTSFASSSPLENPTMTKEQDQQEDQMDLETDEIPSAENQENHRILIETGRNLVLDSLKPEEKTFLETFRYTVVCFLNRMHHRLSSSSSVEQGPTPSRTIVSLNNNPSIHSVWMKVYGVVVMIRMAVLKNVDQVKKWFSLTKRMIKSSTTIFMEKKLKRLQFSTAAGGGQSKEGGAGAGWEVAIQSAEYWIGHDLSIRSVGDRSWIQHILREKALSYQSISQEQRTHQSKSEYLITLNHIAKTCGHEYDAIRSKAVKIFKEVSSRFGSSLETFLRPLFDSISVPGTHSSVALGALSILSLDLIQKRICGNSSLSIQFLKSVRAFPSLLSSIPESDKRERLANNMSVVFGKFLFSWHHIPFGAWTSSSTQTQPPMSRLIQQFLDDFGIKNLTTTTIATSDASAVSTEGSNPSPADDAMVGNGIRHQLYLASSLLIYLGHDDIDIPLGIWDWAIKNVSHEHGHPIQMVSLAALTKLATIEYRKNFLLTNSSAFPSPSPSLPAIQTTLSTLFSSSESCLLFLTGISSSHNSQGGGVGGGSNSAQWSKGVDSMLRNSEYIRNVLPRTETSHCDLAIFSSHFKSSNAAMVMQLLSLLFPPSMEDDSLIGMESILGKLLQASKSIPATNEEEIRSANTVRAELFSGILRFLRQRELLSVAQALPSSLWKELLDYFNEHISKVSQDYCSDWAEGLAFGFNIAPNSPSNLICDSLLRSFQQLLLFSAEDSLSEGATAAAAATTGFAKDAKTILLMRALLVADISAVSRANDSHFLPKDQITAAAAVQKSSQLGSVLLKTITQVSSNDLHHSVFVSPYLAVRIELSKLLVRLVDVEVQEVDSLPDLVKCILFGSQTSPIRGKGEAKSDSPPVEADDQGQPQQQQQDDLWKLSCDIACRTLDKLFQSSIFPKYQALLSPLLAVVLEGCGHYELEFSKLCHVVCLKTAEHLKITSSVPRQETHDGIVDALDQILQLFAQQARNSSSSLHVRETVILCLGIIFINNYPVLTSNEKKLCKDIFAEGLHDPKPEVQVLSIVAMTTYLSIKSIDELNALAASYVKNSDILATRYWIDHLLTSSHSRLPSLLLL
jgi:hypothetical protein